jgi:hypothetical protein
MSSFDVIISDRAVFQEDEMCQTLKIMSGQSGNHVHKALCSHSSFDLCTRIFRRKQNGPLAGA